MATVSNPLTNVVQEAFNLLPTQNAKSTRAAQTATQNVTAQSTASDTVTLASQNVPAQAAGGAAVATAAQTSQPAEIIQYEQITVTAEEIIVTGGGNNGGGANANPGTAAAGNAAPAGAAPAAATPTPVTARPAASNNAAAAVAPAINLAPTANTQNAPLVNAAALPAASALAGSTNSTQQQELAQLDHLLQQMGVDPQSISIFNQLAMLLYVNDPFALQQFVSTLQGAIPQTATQPAAAVAASDTAQTQALAQTPAANQGEQQTGNGTAIEALAFQATYAEVQVAPAGNGATNQGTVHSHSAHHHHDRGNSANANTMNVQGNQPNSNAQNGGYTLQFQELQLSFAAIGIEGGTSQAKPLTRAAAAGSGQGQALNVVA